VVAIEADGDELMGLEVRSEITGQRPVASAQNSDPAAIEEDLDRGDRFSNHQLDRLGADNQPEQQCGKGNHLTTLFRSSLARAQWAIRRTHFC
jgi:hypothetical protein